ncbi:Gfo/Idh/MocA family oxidoreductase [Acidipila sp. EB88]|uniref:Gfo/Idh/MocA family oxidoreductase n=1 Tax=Acidipila sp. EB88 TaxID=2305226 RepID=UPI00131553DE|nr:Gfo/Idh/MocA family oxidoreductase [Acidipila sp. EB88]
MSETIKAGVVGFGLAGQVFHAAVINETPGMEVAAIVERSGKTAAARYPGARIVSSVEEMLQDPSIRLCVVATPNDTHCRIAEQCMRAGRHVVVDKPLALSSADTAALGQVARDAKVVLSAYQNRRWDGDFQTLRELLDSGRIGDPVLFESHFDRFRLEPKPGAWRETEAAGGGILFDLGPHLIDQALCLFGAPTSLWADVRISRPNVEVDDSHDIQLTYEDSPRKELRALRVWLRSTMVAASPGARFTLHGTRATYEKWGLDPQEDALREGARFADHAFGTEAASAWGTLTLPDSSPEVIRTLPGDYRKYYENVRNAICGTAPLEVGVGAAWSVARIIELARESSRTGCRVPVDLSAAATL